MQLLRNHWPSTEGNNNNITMLKQIFLWWIQAFFFVVSQGYFKNAVFAFVPLARKYTIPIRTSAATNDIVSTTASQLFMARRNKKSNRQYVDDLNRWYDEVDDDASPDDVFWEEMELSLIHI